MTGFENCTLFVLRRWQSISYTRVCSVGEWGIIYQQLRVKKEKHVNNRWLCTSAKSTYKSKNSLHRRQKHWESFSLNNPQGRLLAKATSNCTSNRHTSVTATKNCFIKLQFCVNTDFDTWILTKNRNNVKQTKHNPRQMILPKTIQRYRYFKSKRLTVRL